MEHELHAEYLVRGQRYDPSLYTIGSIIRVNVTDFMTYNHIEFYPGPWLNMLIGPNGTGKSSFICALCMGLGGKTALLGRGESLKEFIRRGCNSSAVEIELKAEPRNIVIRRELKMHDDAVQSVYKINNQINTQKEVVNLMQELNIQLDNLCQFLPQDKVVEFAKLNPQELLIETEKALGDATLYNQHKELIDLRKQYKGDEEKYHATDSLLQRMRGDQQSQQRDYDRFQQRQVLLEQAAGERMKILWMEVEKQQQILRQHETKFQEARTLLVEAEQQSAGDDRPIRCAVQNADFVERLTPELAGLQVASDKRKANIQQKLQERSRAIQLLQQHVPVPQETLHQITVLDVQFQQARAAVADLEQNEEELKDTHNNVQDACIRVEDKLKQMDDVKFKRLQKLQREFRGIREAYEWVQRQKQQGGFRDTVFGPVAMEVQVENPLWAMYLENEIPLNKWAQFVAVNREDETKVTNYFRSQGWRIPTASYNGKWDGPIWHPQGEASKYAALGVTHTMDQLFESHPVIKLFLGVGGSFIATPHASMDQIERSGIRRVYTPDVRVDIKVSRYNAAAVSTGQSNLKAAHLLEDNVSSAQVQMLRQEQQQLLQDRQAAIDQLTNISTQLQQARGHMDDIFQQKASLEQQKDKNLSTRRSLQLNAEAANKAYNRICSSPEPMDREPAIRAALQKAATDMMAAGISGSNLMQHLVRSTHELAALELKRAELSMQVEAASAQKQQRQRQLQQLKDTVKREERDWKEAAGLLKESLCAARDQDPQETSKAAWQEEIRQARQGNKLPPSKEELLAKADDLENQAAAIRVNTPAIAAEFQRLQTEIRTLEKQLEQEGRDLRTTKRKMQEIKDAWLPELRNLVQTVNTSFSANFSEIGCAGEVALVEDDDYDKFRVEVRVKFREEEELQVLTAHRQSGGERSVSTILYLIALQGVTQTPFRVVDEINQGMDPVNERKVFDQLVAAASREKTPQCFLLTPKLLPGLQYGDRATVLCIFNGQQLNPQVLRDVTPVAMFGKRISDTQQHNVLATA